MPHALSGCRSRQLAVQPQTWRNFIVTARSDPCRPENLSAYPLTERCTQAMQRASGWHGGAAESLLIQAHYPIDEYTHPRRQLSMAWIKRRNGQSGALPSGKHFHQLALVQLVFHMKARQLDQSAAAQCNPGRTAQLRVRQVRRKREKLLQRRPHQWVPAWRRARQAAVETQRQPHGNLYP